MSQDVAQTDCEYHRTNEVVLSIRSHEDRVILVPETTMAAMRLKFGGGGGGRHDLRSLVSCSKKGDKKDISALKPSQVVKTRWPPFSSQLRPPLRRGFASRAKSSIWCQLHRREIGAWYSYNGDRIVRQDNAREFLRAHPEMALEIENRIRENKGVAVRGVAVTTE